MEDEAMFVTRLARFVAPALSVMMMWQALVAGEPMATSIHDWKSKPAAATPTPDAGPASPATSIHDWKPKPATNPPVATQAAVPAATPAVNPSAPQAMNAAIVKSPVTISLTSGLREGTLVVLLDEVPVFEEKFQKPILLMSQTTKWDPLQVAAGKHTLSAKIYGMKKTYISATYDFDVSRTKASLLRFVLQGDKLKVQLSS